MSMGGEIELRRRNKQNKCGRVLWLLFYEGRKTGEEAEVVQELERKRAEGRMRDKS